jgi:hypothetical protein
MNAITASTAIGLTLDSARRSSCHPPRDHGPHRIRSGDDAALQRFGFEGIPMPLSLFRNQRALGASARSTMKTMPSAPQVLPLSPASNHTGESISAWRQGTTIAKGPQLATCVSRWPTSRSTHQGARWRAVNAPGRVVLVHAGTPSVQTDLSDVSSALNQLACRS